jgi:hypothetical protein
MFELAGALLLDQDVTALEQLSELVLVLDFVETQARASLPAVEVLKKRAASLWARRSSLLRKRIGLRGMAAQRVSFGRFDFDHVGPEIQKQLAAVCPGDPWPELDGSKTVESSSVTHLHLRSHASA